MTIPCPPARPLRLAVLGDSIAFGTGAQSPEHALGPRLVTTLEGAGMGPVQLAVHAVPGAVTAGLHAQVGAALGDDGDADGAVDLAVIVVGANDLIRFVPPTQAAAALGEAVRTLRAAGADVVVVPAPDLSSVPRVPPTLRPFVRAASAVLQRAQGSVATTAGATVAVLAAHVGRRFASEPELFAADRFHPSTAGYAAIAEALAPVVLAAARSRRERSAA